ncbi:hypothetical protein R1sor_003028 [Riccia sorocarpa]|uniref:FCP1 homology domain-containing protein n=1 Tax=Riccia sorocarpa TaxID=122646 RepID=A0ABD3H2K1_9MARC
MAPKKRRGNEIMAPRSPVRRSLRRTVVDVPPDRRGGEESSRGTVRRGRSAGGRGGRGRGRGRTTHGEAAAESESDSAGDAPVPHDPLGRPRRPLRRRMVGDIFSEEEEEPEEPEPEPEEGAKPRRQVRENPLPEGPYRVSWIPIIDRTRYIRWGYLTSEAVYDAFVRITWEEFCHCGFTTILSSDMHPPSFRFTERLLTTERSASRNAVSLQRSSKRNAVSLKRIACCMEFITSFNGDKSSGVVRGRRIRIDDELVRTVFDVPTGTRMISPCIRSSKLHDWMPIRDDVGKRYLTHFVGRFPGCETPWDNTRLARYNISGLIAESIRHECSFVRTHIQRTQERSPEKRRFAETFIGIPLTLIFLHLEIVTQAECEAGAVVPDGGFPLPGGDDSSSKDGDSTHHEAPSATVDRDVLMDELTMLRQESDSLHAEIASLRKMGLRQPLVSPGESRIKTLVLDIFGLFVCVCRTHSDREMAASMGYTVHHLIHPQRSAAIYYVVRGDLTSVLGTLASVAEVIIWTWRSREYTQLILEDMEDERLIPEGFTKRLTIWGIDECDRVRPSRLEREKLTPMKDFRRFYDYRVCTRDVLLVDVEVARNSPNHPFSAVHPWPFGIGLGTSLVDHHLYVMDRLVPWLTEWSVDSSLTPDFVQSQRTRIDGTDPIEGLRRFWGQQPSEADRSIIWRSISHAEGLVLAGLWPAVFGDVRPGDRPGADLVGSVVGEPSLGPEGSIGPTADPLVDSGAEASVRPVAGPLPEPVVVSGAEGSVGAVADPLLQPLVVSGAEGSPLVISGAEGSVGAVSDPLPEPVVVSGAEGLVGAIADPLPELVVVSGAEGSVGAVADPLHEPVVVSGAKGSVGAVADPLPELVVDTGAEGSVGPIPDLSALLIAQTVAELDAEGSAAPPSDE